MKQDWWKYSAGLLAALAVYGLLVIYQNIQLGVQANQVLGYYIQTGALPPLPVAPQTPPEAPESPPEDDEAPVVD